MMTNWYTSIFNKGITHTGKKLLKWVFFEMNGTVKLAAFKKQKQALVDSALPGKEEVVDILSHFYLSP